MDKKPVVKLIGKDGNVFNVIGLVSKALRKNNQFDKAKEFESKAFDFKSYNQVLALAMEYCDVH